MFPKMPLPGVAGECRNIHFLAEVQVTQALGSVSCLRGQIKSNACVAYLVLNIAVVILSI